MAIRFITLLVHDTADPNVPGTRINIDARVVFLSTTLLNIVSSTEQTVDAVSTTREHDNHRVPIIDIPVPFTRGAQYLFKKHIDILIAYFQTKFPGLGEVVSDDAKAIGFKYLSDITHTLLFEEMDNHINRNKYSTIINNALKMDIFTYFGVAASFLDMPFLIDVFADYFSSKILVNFGHKKNGTEWFNIPLHDVYIMHPTLFDSIPITEAATATSAVPLDAITSVNASMCTYCAHALATGTCNTCKSLAFCSSSCFGASDHTTQCAITGTPLGVLYDFGGVPFFVDNVNFFWGYIYEEDTIGVKKEDRKHIGVGFDDTDRDSIVRYLSLIGWDNHGFMSRYPIELITLIFKSCHTQDTDISYHLMKYATNISKPFEERITIVDIICQLLKTLYKNGSKEKYIRPTIRRSFVEVITWRIESGRYGFSESINDTTNGVMQLLDVLDSKSTIKTLNKDYTHIIYFLKDKSTLSDERYTLNIKFLDQVIRERVKRLNLKISESQFESDSESDSD